MDISLHLNLVKYLKHWENQCRDTNCEKWSQRLIKTKMEQWSLMNLLRYYKHYSSLNFLKKSPMQKDMVKDNVHIIMHGKHGMITSAIKKQTSICCSISLNPYNMAFQTWNHGEKKKKKAILLLAYNIADVSCLTNRSFYMRTLSLTEENSLIFVNFFT